MRDQKLAADTAALARFFLGPPDQVVAASFEVATDLSLDLVGARQDFYDYFCIPQSGCFIPPYAHVLARSQKIEDCWHFPAPRYDGGDVLQPWYDVAGFDPLGTALDPMLKGANQPMDHIGFILAFLANVLVLTDTSSDLDRGIVAEFLAEHVLPWARLLPQLLLKADSAYISELGFVLREWTESMVEAYPEALDIPVTPNPETHLSTKGLPCDVSACALRMPLRG